MSEDVSLSTSTIHFCLLKRHAQSELTRYRVESKFISPFRRSSAMAMENERVQWHGVAHTIRGKITRNPPQRWGWASSSRTTGLRAGAAWTPGAVAQKSPCERNRVIMGQESPIQLGQRRQDARQEVPMRTPKPLYAHERMIYHPEILTCPHCGDLLVTCNYLAWDKTVQKLDRVLSVASRPSRCPHATCVGSRLRLLSAAGQRIAPAGSPYGYDVVVRIGWLRQESRATYREIHADLASQVRISASHVGDLDQQVYLPLLACPERQHRDRLAQQAQQQGGVIVALDGLAPQGGEPHMWFIRELSSGVTLRSGWLCQQDQPTFEAFLEPLQHLEWPILAVLSDKQTGLIPAVATVVPNSRHQFCQAHSLRNLAEPLAEADAAFKGELRQTLRG